MSGRLTDEEVATWLAHAAALRKADENPGEVVPGWVEAWQAFIQDSFGVLPRLLAEVKERREAECVAAQGERPQRLAHLKP